MTKGQAFKAMFQGKKVVGPYYTDNEYLFINNDGVFETEDGCTHGYIYDEFWSIYQKWTTGWSIYNDEKQNNG